MSRRITLRRSLLPLFAVLLACLSSAWANNLSAYAIPINTEEAQGFDKCTAPSVSDMATWWTYSPYFWLGIYIGGINASCPPGYRNPNLNNPWIAAVQAQGWDLAPIYVGLQTPCPTPNNVGRFAQFSSDPGTAWNQGIAAAADAIYQYGTTLSLGGPPNPTLIYLDLEGFNYTGPGTACAKATINFLSAWSNRLHYSGARSGIYGSSGSTMKILQDYLASMASPNIPDNIWPAGGGFWASQHASNATVFGNAYIPDDRWSVHQRLYQYTAGHSESYGGNSLGGAGIDSDCGDGQLIGSGSVVVAYTCGAPYH